MTFSAWVAAAVDRPLIYADEAGYLLNARHLAGLGAASGTQYFSGYSYLLAPQFLVSSTYPDLARLVQALNIALLVAGFAGVLVVLRRLAPTLRVGQRTAIGCVTLLYPSYVAFTTLALPEVLLITGFTGVTILTIRAFEVSTPARFVFAGASVGLITVVHPRAVVVVPAFALTVLAMRGGRRLDGRSLMAAVGGTAGGLALSAVLLWMTDSLPGLDAGQGGASGSFAADLLSWAGLWGVATTLVGHALYLLVATLGLAGVGIAVLARLVGRTPAAPSAEAVRSDFARFLLLALAGSMLLAAAFMNGGTGDRAIYGRYNEAFTAIPLALGIAWVCVNRLDRTMLAFAAGSAAAVGAVTLAINDSDRFAGTINRSNVFAVLPLVEWFGGIDILALTVFGVGTLVAVAMIARSTYWAPATVLIGVWFVAVGAFIRTDLLEPDSRARAQQATLADLVRRAPAEVFGGDEPCISLHPGSRASWHVYNYRVLLPQHRFEHVAPGTMPADCNDLALTVGSASPDGFARLVGSENHSEVSLWATSERSAAFYEQHNLIFPAGWDGVVPPAEQQATISVRQASSRGGRLVLKVAVKHGGTSIPWPAAVSAPPGSGGPVRLAVRAVGTAEPVDIERVELPGTLYPGQSAELEFELTPNEQRLLLDPAVQLRMELVQDGVAWFGEHARLDLRIRDA